MQNFLEALSATSISGSVLSFTIATLLILGITKHKLYERSKSVFIVLLMMFMAILAVQFYMFELANYILVAMLLFVYFRAVTSTGVDEWIYKKNIFNKRGRNV